MSVDTPRSPIVIAAFAGWNDTGEAASVAIGHLKSALDSRVIGKIEPDEYYDFQVNRPTGTGDYLADLITEWPTTWYSAVTIPGTGIDVVLIQGPEPSIHWRAFTAEVVEFLRKIKARIVITLGAFPADAPHTRPVRVTATAGDPQTAVRYDFEHSPSTDGPLGISTLFAQAVMNAGIDSVLAQGRCSSLRRWVAQPKGDVGAFERGQ